MTVAVFDRSLLVFGGGGNAFIGKALCGYPRKGAYPGLISGPCSFIARGSRLGRGPTNARVGGQVSKAGQSAVKFPDTSVQSWGEDSILPQSLKG